MPSYTWTSATSGNWSTINDWTPNGVPGEAGGDTVTISVIGADYTVDYDEPLETINSLTINSANATLAMSANATLNVNNFTTLQAGTINLENSADVINIGTLGSGNLNTSAGSVINIGAAAQVTYYGATLAGLVDITGTTNFGSNSAAITLSGTIESTGGTGTVNFAALSGTGILEANGATLLVASSLANSSATAVVSNSVASVFETTGALFFGSGVSIQFLGANGEFEYDNAANDTHVNFNITGLNAGGSTTTPTNSIDLAGETIIVTSGGSGSGATGSVVLSNGDTLALTGITGGTAGWMAHTTSDGSGGTEVFLASMACYARGTMIGTPDGEQAVETLRTGMRVITLIDGAMVPRTVRWVGHRRIDLTRHPRADTMAPIRVERDAFADNVPHRDLLLSPDHAVFIKGMLICVRQLVNGSTIRRETGWNAVDYYHVELDRHAIVLAEGLTVESYLNTGNSAFFENSGMPLMLHPNLPNDVKYPTRETGSCVPFVTDETNVRPVWQDLADRAATLGQPVPSRATTTDASPRLQCPDGRIIEPIHRDNDHVIFALPRDVSEVRLVSRAQTPGEARPWLSDPRRLGLRVKRIVLRDADETREVAMDHPDFARGWWEIERDGPSMSRWTDGAAVLPLPPMRGPNLLEIHLAGTMTYVEDTVPIGGAGRHAA